MNLSIASPTIRREEKIAWIELTTNDGNMIIQPGHAPMIIRLKPQSTATYRLRNGKEEARTVAQGVAHITRAGVTLLITQ